MTNPVTPNIGLNKIDRTSPSTTYFDLEKYIDQNADAVDRFAGESGEAIGALEKRLDTEEHREVVLQPGLQIVNAERSAPFKLSGIKGRTLVNLLGRVGNCEDVSPWSDSGSTHALDNVNKTTGNNGFKITITASSGNTGNIFRRINNIDKTKHYVLLADLKNGNATRIVLQKQNVGIGGSAPFMEVTDNTKFSTVAVKIQPAYFSGDDTIAVLVYGALGQYGYADAIRLYEISEAEYAALDDMTPEQVAAKYPYVDSVQPVRNPYAIQYGENLLPPFYEAFFAGSLAGSPYIVSPYEGIVNASGVNVGFQYWIPCVPNTEYTFAVENDGVIALQDMDKDKVLINNNGGFLNAQRASIITANNAAYLHILMSSGPKGAGTYTFKNPMLRIGTESKRFKPKEASMLALQTDLYADPVSGANADEVFEKDGQYFRLAKWVKATLTDKFNYVGIGGKGAGWKQTFFDLPSNTSGPYSETVIKYDGKKLQSNQITSSPDISAIDSGNAKRCYISIANTDSGWGDNYSPTADEIKAYFMGWMMYDGSGSNATPDNPVNNFYNGTGVKAWAYRADGVTRSWLGWTDKLPTTQAPNWTPYQLLYRLAKESIEPIVSEGMLTLNEGDNQIEVGTGIVVRERAVFAAETPTSGYSYNAAVPGAGQAKYKVKDFLGVYESGRPISGYTKVLRTTHNGAAINVPRDLFNTSAAYSVSYLRLDTSPNVPFTGSYAAYEKAMLRELTDSVRQNTTAVSVLMNKKVDKDQPGWISPTIMNSWTKQDDFGYVRLSNGIILFRGSLKDGILSSTDSAPIMLLPDGYRPKEVLYFPIGGRNGYSVLTGYGTLRLLITPEGLVTLRGQNDMNMATIAWFNNVSFLAEQ
ncbi:hypothetical protein JNUCC32_30135 [Paenibacillus sp. JNUCC32]|uniref:hypothetical protein n=1 Tax=Paenibacillus sp. JNUCC32 TaxID=2777984 RepID=UPI001788507E|nr:hypothetical protein [Paenibacillus sp. JNUCC-32]QOT10293.1 hypothetical protein JNUCC32_30135 [Paenibacillus sp. JNUCC-32]